MREEEWACQLSEYGVSLGRDENVWIEMIAAQHCEFAKCYSAVHFEMADFLKNILKRKGESEEWKENQRASIHNIAKGRKKSPEQLKAKCIRASEVT